MPRDLKSVLVSKNTIALGLMSGFSIALSVTRILFTNRMIYAFMAWNLFLAFVPWLVATILYATRNSNKLVVAGLVLVWLAFFPNAPYVLTDLVHLGYDKAAPEWFDLILLLSYGFTGTLYGFSSLRSIEGILKESFGIKRSWIVSVALVYVSCFGIYLGRFLRWNSWDLVTNLDEVFADVYARFANPAAYSSTWVFTFLFGTLLNLLFFSYKSFGASEPEAAA